MYAVQMTETGGPEVLTWAEIADPELGPGAVTVDLAAAGVNYIDTYHRSGLYPQELPFVPGVEGAGTVTALGPDVDDVSIGDVVAWTGSPGAYSQRVAVPAARLVPVPAGISPDVAAAVTLQGMTAHFLATSTFPLEPGHRCLVHAGAGGVGLLLIQIAKMRGAEVFTSVGTPEKAELASAAGADHTILYRDVDFGGPIIDAAGPRSLDVVYDGVGAETFERGLELLKPRGMMITFGNASGPVPPVTPLSLMQGGSLFLTRPTLGDYTATREDLLARSSDLFSWIAAGSLSVRVGASFPMEEAADAHRLIESRGSTGKILLHP